MTIETPTPAPAQMIRIVSFGYLHGAPPRADVVVDVRTHFRDPHVDPALRYLTAADARVRTAVINTAGIQGLAAGIATVAAGFATGPVAAPVVIAVGCAGGRHRAPTVAMVAGAITRECGFAVAVEHRDMARPVVERA